MLSALGAFPAWPPSRGKSLGDGQGSAGAVRGEPPCFAEKTGVCPKLVALFKSLYKKGWFLTTSSLKLDIKEEETREEISGGFKVADPGFAVTHPGFQFPAFFLLAPFPEHW